MGDGVLHGTSIAVDVDLLAAGNDSAHGERALAPCEVGVLAWWAGSGWYAAGRAVAASLLSDPEVLTVGSDLAEMDRCGGVNGDEAEV